jgi:hypothetical protein
MLQAAKIVLPSNHVFVAVTGNLPPQGCRSSAVELSVYIIQHVISGSTGHQPMTRVSALTAIDRWKYALGKT